MKKLSVIFLFVCVFSPCLGISQTDPSVSKGVSKVLRVLDGTTAVLLLDGKETVVQLIGVDARMKGSDATSCLGSLLAGKDVFIEMEPDFGPDKDGPALAYVYRATDRLFINLEMVRQGCCLADTDRPFRYARDLRTAEREAENARRGIWASSISHSGASASRYYVGQVLTLPAEITICRDHEAVQAYSNLKSEMRSYVEFLDTPMYLRKQTKEDRVSWLGTSMKTYDQEWLKRGRIFATDAVAQAQVIDLDGHTTAHASGLVKVKVLDGKYAGRTGYIEENDLREKKVQ